MKPVKTISFLLGTFLLLAIAMWVSPAEGIKLGEFTFHMPSFQEMFFQDDQDFVDVSEIIENQFSIDSVLIASDDEPTTIVPAANYNSLVEKIQRIELNDSATLNLYRFFERLENDSLVRIMHYGDSQIEGDRMTAFIRNKLQNRFGGTGPGLRPALQPYDFVLSAVQQNSGNWIRYPLYGKVDSTIEHNNYGVMAAFSRFVPPVNDSVPQSDSTFYEASLTIEKTSVSFAPVRVYEYFRMFYGNVKMQVEMNLLVGDSVLISETLKTHVDFDVVEADLPDTTSRIQLVFKGYDSPDIYGIELASREGVIVDNIASRGSSGLFFTRKNAVHSRKLYRELDPGLFILQFGGNTVPYLTEKEKIENYGRWFRAQIKWLKKICPDAAILVIGPSDMSTKMKDRYVTFEHLPHLVDVLRKTALAEGCGYWDMYEAMGGFGSMPSWVNAHPGLARPDYVHFSLRGARLIANMFYNALIFEYNNYLQEKS
ncbi:hypothetical protein KQH65_12190 [archaeon]|nr:hypothetical protein [archaeon]